MAEEVVFSSPPQREWCKGAGDTIRIMINPDFPDDMVISM